MTASKRFDLIKSKKLCRICLAAHKEKCTIQSGCKTCGKTHNTLLHFPKNEVTKKLNTNVHANTEVNETESENNISTLHVDNSSESRKVLLATALIRIKTGYGKFDTVRALIDQGSQSSFVTTRAAQRLKLKINRSNATVSGLGTTNSGVVRGEVSVHMAPRFESPFCLNFRALRC